METPPLPPATETRSSGLTDRQWAVFMHLSGFLAFLVPHCFNILAPLVIWLFKKSDSPYLDDVGKRVLNFQISYSIYGFLTLTAAALTWWFVVGLIFFPLYGLIGLAWVILMIVGAVKEGNGERFEYPFTIRFFS